MEQWNQRDIDFKVKGKRRKSSTRHSFDERMKMAIGKHAAW